MIIASVRYDEQRFLRVVCPFHLAQAEINAIEQGRLALGGGEHQVALQFFDAGGEGIRQLGAVVEIDQQKFVLRIRGAEELHGGEARLFDLVGHAGAHVKDHADGDGHVLAGEAHDFLFDVVFEDAEVLLLEAGNQAAVGVA